MKQQWQVAVYTSPVTIRTTSNSSHTALCPKATILSRFGVCDHTKISNLKYLEHRKFLGDSTFQQ